MKLTFKQSVHLGGHDYKLGNHEVPESHTKDVNFQKYLDAGYIVNDVKEESVSADALLERQKQSVSDTLAGAKAPASQPEDESDKGNKKNKSKR